MFLPKFIRSVLKAPLNLALKCGFIRRRVAFELKQRWFAELNVSIPLTHDFACPIAELDALYSFSEIFASGEYGHLLQHVPLPLRWIDLGCHAGYFTLYLAWQHAVAGENADWHALLVDADPRAERQASKTLVANGIGNRCCFLEGAIVSDSTQNEFALRTGMGSSQRMDLAGIESTCRVRRVSPEEILEKLAPPYDLIKIDIEGAEYDFLECYAPVLAQASSVLLEWHSFGETDSDGVRANALLEREGFSLAAVLRPKRILHVEGMRVVSGVHLYRRVQ